MAVTTFRPSQTQGPSWFFIAVAMALAIFLGLVAAVMDNTLVLILFLPVIPVIWILFDYRAGVVFLTFIFPFSQSPFLPKFTGFNIIGYLALATLLSFGLHQLGHRHILLRPPSWLVSLYVMPVFVATGMGVFHLHEVPDYMVVMSGFAQNTPARYIKDLLLYPMLTLLWMWMLATAMRASDRPQRYIWVVLGSGLLPAIQLLAVVAVLGISGISVETLSSSSAGAIRNLLSLTGFHANEIGVLLASAFGPLLFVTPTAKTLGQRLLLWPMLGLVTLALLLSFSRGAYVAAGVAVLFFLARARGHSLAKVFIVVTLVAMLAAMSGALISRVSEGWSGTASSTARASAVSASRTIIWNALWPEVAAHPFVGNGLRSTVWSLAARQGVFPSHPHSLYLEILLDMGAVGLIMLLMFFRRFALLLKKSSEATRDTLPMISAYLNGAYAAFLGYLVSAIANGHYTPVPENTFFWASFGVALAYSTVATRQRVLAGNQSEERDSIPLKPRSHSAPGRIRQPDRSRSVEQTRPPSLPRTGVV